MLIDVDDGWGECVAACRPRQVAAESGPDRLLRARRAGRGGAPLLRGGPRWGVECGYDEVRPVGLGSAGRRRSGRPRWLGDLRGRAGWPAMGREITEQTIPAELGPLLDVAVSFTKGATPARACRAHALPRRVGAQAGPTARVDRRPLRAGAPVTVEGREVGTVTMRPAWSHWRSSAGRSSRGPRCRSPAPRRSCSRSLTPTGLPTVGAVRPTGTVRSGHLPGPHPRRAPVPGR